MGVAKWRCARLPGHVQDGDEELLPARRLHALPPLLQALQLGDRAPLGAHRACVLRVLRVAAARGICWGELNGTREAQIMF